MDELERLKAELTRAIYEKDVLGDQVEELKRQVERHAAEATVTFNSLVDERDFLREQLKKLAGIADLGDTIKAKEEEKSKKLEAEIALLHEGLKRERHRAEVAQGAAKEAIQAAANAAASGSRGSFEEMLGDRKRLHRIVSGMMLEVSHLKQVYPLRAMAKVKETEVQARKRLLSRLPKDHPQRREIEEFLKAAVIERDSVLQLAEEASERLAQEAAKLRELIENGMGNPDFQAPPPAPPR